MSRRRQAPANIFSVPGAQDILSLAPALGESQADPAHPNISLDGVDLGSEWMSNRGNDGRFVSNGVAYVERKVNETNVSRARLGAAETVDVTHRLEPFDDGTPMSFPKGIPVFSFKQHPTYGNGHYDAQIGHVNQMMYLQYRDHLSKRQQGSDVEDTDHIKFARYLEVHGERALWHLVSLRARHQSLEEHIKPAERLQQLQEFEELARRDDMFYLSLYGIYTRLAYTGLALNDTSLETMQSEDWSLKSGDPTNYATLVMAVFKNAECGNIFGEKCDVDTQSFLWLTCKRSYNHYTQKYEHFEIVASSSNNKAAPYDMDVEYRDPSNAKCRGLSWYVASVIQPPSGESSEAMRENALNLGMHKNVHSALESYQQLPRIRVNLGQ